MNPFDWTGPEFIRFYVALLGVGAVLAVTIRSKLRLPARVVDTPPLSPYQTAYLAGGPWQAFAAALTRLIDSGAIQEASGSFVRNGDLAADALPLERRMWRVSEKALSLESLFQRSRGALRGIRKQLERFGLVTDRATDRRIRWIPAMLLVAIGAVGLAKLVVGLTRGAPVFFLILCLVAATVGACYFLFTRVLRTRRGDAVLAQMRQKHDALGALARTNPGGLAAADLPLAVALFGTAALAGPAYAGLHQHLAATHKATGGGGGCGAGCGSSSCGGGGSSCGGSSCGGGGCGGCGGGGD